MQEALATRETESKLDVKEVKEALLSFKNDKDDKKVKKTKTSKKPKKSAPKAKNKHTQSASVEESKPIKTSKGKQAQNATKAPKEHNAKIADSTPLTQKLESSPILHQPQSTAPKATKQEIVHEPSLQMQVGEDIELEPEFVVIREQKFDIKPSIAPKPSILQESLMLSQAPKDKRLKSAESSQLKETKDIRDELKETSEAPKEVKLESSQMPTKPTIQALINEELEPLELSDETKPQSAKSGSSVKLETRKVAQNDEADSKATKIATHRQSAEVATQRDVRAQVLYRSALAKESVKNFASALREEVQNYKPPLTKLTMELHPQNLGTLELTITKKGKDLLVQVVSNAQAVGLFVQNQVDFRQNLAQVGFDNVDLSFSASGKDSGANSGNQGGFEQENQNNAEAQEWNENSLEQEHIDTMHIRLPKYA